ncbi:hypothetical protein NECAME_02115 [Necator americanus]|uniref:Uncharacterized protein n=1 Tax=Necator americanus TaxID=51031 RepID=W2THA3_NECAM|nr:hypothetical protein NECAME_02115 [Necator americanus]ETN81435.1 hypothetical protein NECAME_02115 [Necator americanus]
MNVNLAITMTCMVNSTAIAIADDIDTGGDWSKDPNLTSAFGTSDTCSSAPGTRTVLDYGGSLVWNHAVQNLLFSASFWGALVTIIPAIFLVQRMNKKIVLMLCVANKHACATHVSDGKPCTTAPRARLNQRTLWISNIKRPSVCKEY